MVKNYMNNKNGKIRRNNAETTQKQPTDRQALVDRDEELWASRVSPKNE